MTERADPLSYWNDQFLDTIRAQLDELTLQFDEKLLPEKSEDLFDAIRRATSSEVMNPLVTKLAAEMYPVLIQQAGDIVHDYKEELQQPETVIREIWGKALFLLQTFILISIESGSDTVAHLRAMKLVDHPLSSALVPMHARCCRIAHELLVLCQHGYPDGAHARWRTIYEISITGIFLKQHDSDVVTRYLEHAAVSARKAARSHREHHARLEEPPPSDEAIAALEERCEELRRRYGGPFLRTYGWAAAALGKKQPTFIDIERAVGLTHWRPYYYLANLNIHADVRGDQWSLGNPYNKGMQLVGPSYLGLADPVHGAALALMWITFAVLGIHPTLDVILRQKILAQLHDEIRDEVSSAHTRSVDRYREYFRQSQDADHK